MLNVPAIIAIVLAGLVAGEVGKGGPWDIKRVVTVAVVLAVAMFFWLMR